ncbi:heterokaryon incompatibility protein-domain-containing protein [Lasiosphaeris hirsuta]|uniref:Heterokaryon incompatibility protein-domain-containing protein n=1 Tax=Lasiosphaeris hirsuta TaxID=260670 RepID=A0AA40DSK0_9PEZI|nr:heterokaryon incompatibility protein-domain-containing protein [Lasiosphaeris hirsuta]
MERHAERKARELGYNHTYELHSCQYCSWIVFDQADVGAKGDGEHLFADQLSSASNVVLADNLADALRARDANCPLLGYLLSELMDDPELSPAMLDVDGSGTVYGSLTDRGLKLSHRLGGMALVNMLKVSIHSDDPAASLDCDPASPAAFELSRSWVSTCASSHPLCRPPPSPFMPTRVLQVNEQVVRLRESFDLGKNQWCALSYVWGGDQPVKTTKASLHKHYNGIAFDRLPQALGDAVRVCRALGVPYLWIDALCIVQDDPADLRSELSRMPEIYQYATATISAASSTKADDGFLFPRGHWYRQCPPVRLQAVTESGGRVAAFAYEKRLWESEPIGWRAWTFQEHALSPRVLSYRSTLLEWSCRTLADSYGLLEPTTLLRNSSGVPEPPYSLSATPWSDIVEGYSMRRLTFGSDKLRALSAIARVYHRETGKKYLAGLWEEDLPLGLCWVPAMHGDSPRIPPPAEYRAPSWSWASIDSPVAYLAPHPSDQNHLRATRCEVLSAVVTPAYAGGEFDSVASGSLTVRGAMKALGSSVHLDWCSDGAEIRVGRHTVVVTLDAEDGVGPGRVLSLLLLAEFFEDQGEEESVSPGYVGLLLEEAGQRDARRRLGSFQCCRGAEFGEGHDRCRATFEGFEDRTAILI